MEVRAYNKGTDHRKSARRFSRGKIEDKSPNHLKMDGSFERGCP
jgi:hypothetical protein